MPENLPESDIAVIHIRYGNGSLGKLVAGPGVDAELPPDVTVLTEEEYLAEEAALAAAHEAYVAEIKEVELALVLTDFNALLGAGVPEATARRLTGYTGSVSA